MTDGNTYAINQHLNEREDYDALQEVTAALELAEARIEELESELEGRKKLMLTLAGDKIDLVSELAGIKFKLAKAVGNLASVMSQYDRFREDEYAVGLAPLDDAIETARTTLAELRGETDE